MPQVAKVEAPSEADVQLALATAMMHCPDAAAVLRDAIVGLEAEKLSIRLLREVVTALAENKGVLAAVVSALDQLDPVIKEALKQLALRLETEARGQKLAEEQFSAERQERANRSATTLERTKAAGAVLRAALGSRPFMLLAGSGIGWIVQEVIGMLGLRGGP